MQCLEMQARTFFTMLKEGRINKTKETAFFFHEMTNVVLSSIYADHGQMDFSNALKEHYSSIYKDKLIDKKIPEVLHERALDAASPDTGNLLIDLAKQKMRLEGLH